LNINQLDTGSYILTVTDAGGCLDSETITLVNGSTGNVDAIDDNYITQQDVAIQTSPSDNDILGSNPTIIGSPLNGTMSNSFFYSPSNGYFGMDSVQYYICDIVCNTVCDTATIYIDVTEERPIKIHTGFSPNGDGINETFNIENIELFPENELVIFSRWGDQVYAAQPYNNEWDGSSEATGVKLSGDKVVDGAYYFILRLTPDSEPINGFIDLRR
jgi:gliding motility-associated-like protein